jgi:hypothetical protein
MSLKVYDSFPICFLKPEKLYDSTLYILQKHY